MRELLPVQMLRRLLEVDVGRAPHMNTLFRWVQSGVFPTVRIGSKIFVQPVVYRDLVEAMRRGEKLGPRNPLYHSSPDRLVRGKKIKPGNPASTSRSDLYL